VRAVGWFSYCLCIGHEFQQPDARTTHHVRTRMHSTLTHASRATRPVEGQHTRTPYPHPPTRTHTEFKESGLAGRVAQVRALLQRQHEVTTEVVTRAALALPDGVPADPPRLPPMVRAYARARACVCLSVCVCGYVCVMLG
jgi:hypothetical protein